VVVVAVEEGVVELMMEVELMVVVELVVVEVVAFKGTVS
jgi:hypothetical protein